MRYAFVQNLLRLFQYCRVAYHLAAAAAAAHEDGDERRDSILALMTDEERDKAREARNGNSRY